MASDRDTIRATVETFHKDVTEHEMTVLHDHGLFRCIKFARPGNGIHWFELVTTPGQLAIRGDMGTYVFERAHDMFDFFAQPEINPGYWGEKLEAVDVRCGYRRYSPGKFAAAVRENVEELASGLDEAKRADLWKRIDEDVLPEGGSEGDARRALDSFEFEGLRFEDSWEWDLREYSRHFLWCCEAIRWGIEQYRAGGAS